MPVITGTPACSANVSFIIEGVGYFSSSPRSASAFSSHDNLLRRVLEIFLLVAHPASAKQPGLPNNPLTTNGPNPDPPREALFENRVI